MEWLKVAAAVLTPTGRARYRAARYNLDELELMGGWVRLVRWDPNEGVIVLRNKRLHFVDQKGEGGTHFLLPILGDELAARVGLNERFLVWEDHKILTRESLQISARIGIWWRITDLPRFLFGIEQFSLAGTNQQFAGPIESAEAWMCAKAESVLRSLVSQAAAAELISSLPAHYLSMGNKREESSMTQLIPDQVANSLATDFRCELEAKIAPWGVALAGVEIQEIRLSEEIQEAINKVWVSFLKPVQSEQEAKARQVELESMARVLGTDTVALTEIFKSLQGSTLLSTPPMMVQPVLQSLLQGTEHRTVGLGKPGAEPTFPVSPGSNGEA